MAAGSFLIPGLPESGPFGNLALVPSWKEDAERVARGEPAWWDATIDEGGRREWRDWRKRLIRYRIEMDEATSDEADPAERERARKNEIKRCSADVRYMIAVHGWIYAPRDFEDPDYPHEGWKPWAPIPPQMWLLDEIDEALKRPSPEGDILVEKSRDMGATWLFCAWMAHRWLFARSFTAGLMSYREAEVVEDHPDSMLYKTKSFLGLEPNVPGIPGWMFADTDEGERYRFHKKKLDLKATLQHPTRTNFLRGETTTDWSGVGNRAFVRLHDEAARWRAASLRNVMTNTANTTNHRWLLSTANTEHSDDFRRMADKLRDLLPEDRSMRFVRLDTKYHPFHDDAYIANERRKAELNDDVAGFEREVLINYRGGAEHVYAQALRAAVLLKPTDEPLVWLPTRKTVVSVDPGLGDECGVVVAQVEPRPDATGDDPSWPRGVFDVYWLDAYMLAGQGMDFWSHVLTGVYPEPGDAIYPVFGSEGRNLDRRLRDFMALMATLPKWGPRIRWTGDPAGESREQTSKTTWYKELAKTSKVIVARDLQKQGKTPPPSWPGIYPWTKDLHKHNSYQERQIHTRPVLRRSTFAANPGARELWAAIDGAHRLDPTPRQQSEPGMAHDKASALWTACEYLSVWLRVVHAVGNIKEEREQDEDIDALVGLPPGFDPRTKQRRAA